MNGRLRQAVMEGATEKIIAAVRDGDDVNARDEGGETVLTVATAIDHGREGALTRVKCLLDLGALVSAEHPNGGLGTSVHQATENGYTEALKALLAADGRVALQVFDDLGRTPLIIAARNGRLNEARLLIDAGAQVDARDIERSGDTALSAAVMGENPEVVELLLQHGADPNVKGWMNLSARDRARRWSSDSLSPARKKIRDLLQVVS